MVMSVDDNVQCDDIDICTVFRENTIPEQGGPIFFSEFNNRSRANGLRVIFESCRSDRNTPGIPWGVGGGGCA